jgi:hypothetical protein
MTGYVRVDTSNNIADGNVINAADLDNEFDGVQAAFSAITGHTHGGGVGQGAPITSLGPSNDVTIGSSLMAPKTTNTVDIGSSSLKFKDLHLVGDANIANLVIDGSITEEVFTLTGTILSPTNGSIQTVTLSANTTFTETLASGQSMILGVDDGTARTVTWPTITWTTIPATAPSLPTTGFLWIVLWKVGSTLYGKY